MNDERKIKKLNQHIDTLAGQIEKLKHENETLRRANDDLRNRVKLADDAIKEYQSLIDEVNFFREDLKKQRIKYTEIAVKYKKKMDEQLRRIRKQK